MAHIVLKNICKTYPNGVSAVDNFNLEIEDKEFIIFVGPSGCGKSTTLRMIAGLEDITAGELLIDGKIMNEIPPKDRDIAMVFQSYALYPHMTVYDNIAFGLRRKKLSKAELDEKVKNAARILGLESQLAKKPRELSGGQKQRVAMGAAIVRNPKVFLMDEPLSNLDAKLRVQMRVELARLHESLGATIVYVTHDQTEAMTLGSRIVVMKEGIIQQVDTPNNLYTKPANMFVAGFIGSPQMNFLYSVVKEEDGATFLQLGDVRLPVTEEQREKLRGMDGKQIVLGIRPEDIMCGAEAEKYSKWGITVTAEVYELLGSSALLYFEFAGSRVTADVKPGVGEKEGERVHLALHMERAHLFDAATEQRI